MHKKDTIDALLNGQDGYMTIFENMGTAAITVDRNTNILMANSEFEKLSGYSKKEIEDKKIWTDFFVKDDLKKLKEQHRAGRIDPSTASKSHEFRFTDRNGHIRIVLVKVAVIPGTEISVFSFLDMTEYKRKKEQAERTNRDLKGVVKELEDENQRILERQKSIIEEERLKVLLNLAGATAHELSQPLMALLGNIELIELNKGDPEKLDRHLSQMKKAGQRMSDILVKIRTLPQEETKISSSEMPGISHEQKITILSVEESDDDFEKLKAILNEHEQITLGRARCMEEALGLLERDEVDLIFSDYFLPDGNGLDFINNMEKGGVDIPVVIITGQGDEMTAVKVIQAGAYDYLSKSRVSDESISRIIANTLEKSRLKREINKAQKKMVEMSTRDELTGLYNRRFLNEVLEKEVARAKRYGEDLSLCMMDLDHFKKINDTYGHTAGDMVLSNFAWIVKTGLRQSDLCCRYGGEEFAAILPKTNLHQALEAAERIRKMLLEYQFQYNRHEFYCTVSIGIASYNPDWETPSIKLVEAADQALYRAKKEGRNRVIVL